MVPPQCQKGERGISWSKEECSPGQYEYVVEYSVIRPEYQKLQQRNPSRPMKGQYIRSKRRG